MFNLRRNSLIISYDCAIFVKKNIWNVNGFNILISKISYRSKYSGGLSITYNVKKKPSKISIL